jgi:hypothetical protein
MLAKGGGDCRVPERNQLPRLSLESKFLSTVTYLADHDS